MKIINGLLSGCFALLLSYSAHHERAWAVRKPTAQNWRSPRVLLIGDSILYGYLPTVQRELAGDVVVDSWTTPLHQASPGMNRMLEDLVASESYSVIHINLGLHGWEPGIIPAGDFRPIMEELVRTIRRAAPKATLIWATTTPTMNPAIEPTTILRNQVAWEVVSEQGGRIHDLYGAMETRLSLLLPDGVHWTAAGREVQGITVARALSAALKK